MSDSKLGDAEVPALDVTRISVEPNVCELAAPLTLEVDFMLDKPIAGGVWEVKYLVDSVAKRHIIVLGKTPATDYAAGANSFRFTAPYIDVSSVKRSRLANAGLLIASLTASDGVGGEQEIADVTMVVQVTEETPGAFIRTIFNPLE